MFLSHKAVRYRGFPSFSNVVSALISEETTLVTTVVSKATASSCHLDPMPTAFVQEVRQLTLLCSWRQGACPARVARTGCSESSPSPCGDRWEPGGQRARPRLEDNPNWRQSVSTVKVEGNLFFFFSKFINNCRQEYMHRKKPQKTEKPKQTNYETHDNKTGKEY